MSFKTSVQQAVSNFPSFSFYATTVFRVNLFFHIVILKPYMLIGYE